MIRARSALTIACLSASLVACTSEPPRSSAPADAPAATSTPETSAPESPSSSGTGSATYGPAETRRDPNAPLAFAVQDGWVAEAPTSAMRKAQYRLPAVAGDAQDATLVVFHFKGSGGSVDDNLRRWAAQFEQPDGSSSYERMRMQRRPVAGLPATVAELSGTYVAETSPGSGERVHEPGWALRAAIVETGHGPYYVKLVGPEKTVARWQRSYDRFLAAIE